MEIGFQQPKSNFETLQVLLKETKPCLYLVCYGAIYAGATIVQQIAYIMAQYYYEYLIE
jgi:hypothetical protein